MDAKCIVRLCRECTAWDMLKWKGVDHSYLFAGIGRQAQLIEAGVRGRQMFYTLQWIHLHNAMKAGCNREALSQQQTASSKQRATSKADCIQRITDAGVVPRRQRAPAR
jgi:hypothetical protein